MEESDDGGLEAVVRGGRGYNNNIRMYNNNNNPYGWQPSLIPLGMDSGPIENASIEEGLVTGSISMTQMVQVDSSSQMNMFANMLRTSTRPPATDLQEVCSPFFNGNLLRSGSSSSKLLFENMEAVQASSPIFAADSPTASMFSSVEIKPAYPIKAEPETEFGKLTALKSVEAVSPTRLSSLVPEPDVTISKPLKVEPSTIKEGDGSSLSIQVRTDSAIENGSSSQTTGSAKGQGSKRRKTQQKRIVCVPAAGGSNRPSGEGLPSDLWAWRKYGQKPIKGSPYPRGYYRCSSSKGCSARKQVERSRTDPNMLVITYTSDHNHPWPTHRNALAGSTRQAEKVNTSEKDNADQRPENSCVPENTPFSSVMDSSEATASEGLQHMGAAGSNSSVQEPDSAIQQNDPTGVTNILTNAHHHDEDFFAELEELPESLNIFSRHFHDDKSDDEAASSVLDPFNLFNWSSTTFPDTKTAPLPQF